MEWGGDEHASPTFTTFRNLCNRNSGGLCHSSPVGGLNLCRCKIQAAALCIATNLLYQLDKHTPNGRLCSDKVNFATTKEFLVFAGAVQTRQTKNPKQIFSFFLFCCCCCCCCCCFEIFVVAKTNSSFVADKLILLLSIVTEFDVRSLGHCGSVHILVHTRNHYSQPS